MRFMVAVGLGIAITYTAHAQNQQIAQDKKITQIHTYVNGASFQYSPSSPSGYGCTGTASTYSVHIDWRLDPSYKAMYAAAIAAYSSGKTVGFGVNGCVMGFGGDIPNVYRIDIKD